MIKNVQERITELITDPEVSDEQLEFFEKRLWENQVYSESKSMKFLFFFAFTAAVWFFIKSASISKLSFIGLEFEELSIPMLVLPPIAAFCFYIFHCYFGISNVISRTLDEYYAQKLQSVDNTGLTALLVHPTVQSIEISVVKLGEKSKLSSLISLVWPIIMAFILWIFPLPLLIWMAWCMFTSSAVSTWSIGSLVLVAVLVIQSWLVFRNSGDIIKKY